MIHFNQNKQIEYSNDWLADRHVTQTTTSPIEKRKNKQKYVPFRLRSWRSSRVVFPVDERSFVGRERLVVKRGMFLDYAGRRFGNGLSGNCRWSSSWGRSSVTPVRRREDTEGNRYTRVEVQLGCCSAASFLEGLSEK